MTRKSSAFALFALIAAACLGTCLGHGYLEVPAAKQLSQRDITPQNGQGNGARNPGVCGDPFQGHQSNIAGIPFNQNTNFVYSTNGLIRVSVKLTANHGGRHSFRVCPSTTPSDVCFGNNFLTAEGNPSGGANPVNGKRYWYIPNPAGTGSFSSQWRLPAGVSCANGCILQWKWAAYQTCALPCESPSVDDMSKCDPKIPGNKRVCDAWEFPEVFNNCADIKITGSGSGTPITPTNPSNPTTPKTPTTPTTPTTPSTPKTPTTPTTPNTPGGCVDTFAACPGWRGMCHIPGVPTHCPCMCSARSG